LSYHLVGRIKTHSPLYLYLETEPSLEKLTTATKINYGKLCVCLILVTLINAFLLFLFLKVGLVISNQTKNIC